MRALLDLVLPVECGGCRTPGNHWCRRCAVTVATTEPVAVSPRAAGVPPAWATGPYAGPWRGAVIAAKERGRRDLVRPLGTILVGAIGRLREWGELDPAELAPLALVVAPSRGSAARARGGDPVARITRECARQLAAGAERATVHEILRTDRRARDSVGLTAAQRTVNLAGRIRVRGTLPAPGTTVLLIDDVLTTGATAAAATTALAAVGVPVRAVLVLAAVR